MAQAIRDLEDAFVPSGRLAELVDVALVSVEWRPFVFIYKPKQRRCRRWRCLVYPRLPWSCSDGFLTRLTSSP